MNLLAFCESVGMWLSMSFHILPNRAFLRLQGPDAARYLSGQITQKVEGLGTEKTLWTAVTNAKGGIEGVGCIQQLEDGSYLFDCPLELGDDMEARLDRYLIADDCEWIREDDRWLIAVGESGEESSRYNTISNRFREDRLERIYDLTQLRPDDMLPLSEELEVSWCAQNAVPRWQKEILPGKLPAEVGLYDLALSFDKGCYIGQEIISRMETAGKTRTKLYRVVSDTELSFEEFSTIAKIEGDFYGLVVSKKMPEGKEAK